MVISFHSILRMGKKESFKGETDGDDMKGIAMSHLIFKAGVELTSTCSLHTSFCGCNQ